MANNSYTPISSLPDFDINHSKVYIFCFPNFKTGGIEALHQLASCLLSFGVEAYLYYDNATTDPEEYQYFHIPYVTQPENTEQNWIIVPESATDILYSPLCNNMQKIIWWLSVDNYLNPYIRIYAYFKNNPLVAPLPPFFQFQNTSQKVYHWVQSEYARQFLIRNNIPSEAISYVSDYLNPVFIDASQNIRSKREDIVAYYPKKGADFVVKLIAANAGLTFVPIEHMSAEEVMDLLSRAKVYIDFGNHPGMDRIPREAALCGCCIITGRRGAAGNNIDIPIPDTFKFEDSETSIPAILSCIESMLDDYDTFTKRFDSYRTVILNEMEQYFRDVQNAFRIPDLSSKPKLCLLQSDDAGLHLWINLLRINEYAPCFMIDDRRNNKNLQLPDGQTIQLTSFDDARILYRLSRIDYFVYSNVNNDFEEKKNFYLEKLAIDASQIICI